MGPESGGVFGSLPTGADFNWVSLSIGLAETVFFYLPVNGFALGVFVQL
jgi:hypothetical protein